MIRRSAIVSVVLLGACAPHLAPAAPRPAGAFTADSTHTIELASGVTYTRMHIPRGPWDVYVVAVAPGAHGVEFHTVKGLDHVVGRERPSSVAQRTAAAERRPVLAAVNADFFNFKPPGVSEGPQVSAGRVVKSEDTHRAALADTVLREQPSVGVDAGGKIFFADAHVDGWFRVGQGEPVPVRGVNTSVTRGSAAVYNSAHVDGWFRVGQGEPIPVRGVNTSVTRGSAAVYNSFLGARTSDDSGVVEVIVRTVRAAALAGDTAVGVVVGVDSALAGVDIPAGDVVIAERERQGAHADFSRSLEPGDSVWWSLRIRNAPAKVKELVGGFPMLLRNGVAVVDRTTDMIPGFSEKRHPRTVVARRSDGTVMLVAVDGRRQDSVGMSLEELTDFMKALGASDALNLDGGGSTTLVVDGRVVNRPSDKEGERAVSNVLLLLGPK